jgi:mono/diheme cytochrome c family protein
MTANITKKLILFLQASGLLLLAACGGRDSASTAIPTATPIPTYSYSLPTEAPQVATAAATLASGAGSGLDPEMVERGRGRYEALECAACHGDAGEGTDDGSSLIESPMDEAAFISFMRSGGELGADHQYSTNRLSDSGGRNLFQYLLSLRPAP